MDFLYSSGLLSGYVDSVQLPSVLQFDLGISRKFEIPGLGTGSNRITFMNLFDRTNLIRPADGIGVFQTAYGPRFTIMDTLTIPLP